MMQSVLQECTPQDNLWPSFYPLYTTHNDLTICNPFRVYDQSIFSNWKWSLKTHCWNKTDFATYGWHATVLDWQVYFYLTNWCNWHNGCFGWSLCVWRQKLTIPSTLWDRLQEQSLDEKKILSSRAKIMRTRHIVALWIAFIVLSIIYGLQW